MRLRKSKYRPLLEKHFRIIDNSGIDTKRIVITKKNIASGFNEENLFWMNYIAYKKDRTDGLFSRSMYMSVQDGYGNFHPLFIPEYHNKYYINNFESVSVEGASDSVTEFSYHNSHESHNHIVTIYLDNLPLSRSVVAAGATSNFRFRDTIWAYATNDLNEEIEWQNINTEISLLGVHSSDLVLSLSGGIYQWSLSNIVFA